MRNSRPEPKPFLFDQMVNNDVAMVRAGVSYQFDSQTHYVTAVGVARRHPADKPRNDRGVALASARALQNVARRMERQINGLIKHEDDLARAKAAKAAQAKTPPKTKAAAKPKPASSNHNHPGTVKVVSTG